MSLSLVSNHWKPVSLSKFTPESNSCLKRKTWKNLKSSKRSERLSRGTDRWIRPRSMKWCISCICRLAFGGVSNLNIHARYARWLFPVLSRLWNMVAVLLSKGTRSMRSWGFYNINEFFLILWLMFFWWWERTMLLRIVATFWSSTPWNRMFFLSCSGGDRSIWSTWSNSLIIIKGWGSVLRPCRNTENTLVKLEGILRLKCS